jgi:hypothetical protein
MRHALAGDAWLQRRIYAGAGKLAGPGVTKAAIGQPTRVKRLPPHMTECYTHVVDMWHGQEESAAVHSGEKGVSRHTSGPAGHNVGFRLSEERGRAGGNGARLR